MRLRVTFLLLMALPLAGCWPITRPSGIRQAVDLELVSALALDVPVPLEPSGLALLDGVLYTVADKDDSTIYRVEMDGQAARLVPHLEFTPPFRYRMDWEGITADAQGNFYLISEEWGRVLRVRPDGSNEWVTPDLMRATAATGLFAKPNAGFEGIALLGQDHFIGAVEREPRGLVEYRLAGGKSVILPTLMEVSPYSNALPLHRLPDYAGLDTDQGKLYALFRGAHLVVELQGSGKSLQEVAAWNYRHIETDPRWAYLAQTYGQAEGLVVEGREVWIIFDNNLGGRQSDPDDGRPLLVHARMPGGD